MFVLGTSELYFMCRVKATFLLFSMDGGKLNVMKVSSEENFLSYEDVKCSFKKADFGISGP